MMVIEEDKYRMLYQELNNSSNISNNMGHYSIIHKLKWEVKRN
jgi:hypothetical protein